MKALLALALALSCAGVSHGDYVVAGMDEQVQDASACVKRWREGGQGPSTAERLAAVYLHSHSEPSMRDSLLACSINNLLQNVGQKTPLDIFVFVLEAAHAHMSKKLNEQLQGNASRVCMLKVSKKQWYHSPRKTSYKQAINENRYGNYLVMGQWRMLVPFNIISALGYPFFLQVDDDLMVLEPLQVNIVQEMRRRNMTMATHRKPVEYWHVMFGLPELAKFYLLSHNLTSKGSLFRHLTPPDMTGLFSAKRNWWKQPHLPKEGYDLVILYGNFLVMSTTLWRDEKVQDFITLCVNSGGLERHRWQEQGVFTFVYLLFTEPHELWYLSHSWFKWLHTRRKEKLRNVCGSLI